MQKCRPLLTLLDIFLKSQSAIKPSASSQAQPHQNGGW
uniref:Uncharacterized protein n=1 Tax=Tetranychus urticae TaxID=32264 RepID=T1JXZ3_TETUR